MADQAQSHEFEEEKKQLLQLFKDIDKDNSGTVEKNELIEYSKTKGIDEQALVAMFNSMDYNADGKITLEEYEEKVGLIPPKARKGLVWRSVFESYDKDHNGTLDKAEFLKCLKENNMGQNVTDAQIEEFVKSIDSSGDGKVDYKEYVKWLTNRDIDEEVDAPK